MIDLPPEDLVGVLPVAHETGILVTDLTPDTRIMIPFSPFMALP